jgi:Barstar (barnase inhibitor)
MRTARKILENTSTGGVFSVDRRPGAQKVVDQAAAAGWRAVVLDGHRTPDKESLLREIAAALEFPEWFGHNWDALADCLREASAAAVAAGGKGVCLVWTRADLLAFASTADVAHTFAGICSELAKGGSPVLLLARSSVRLTELEDQAAR